MADGRFDDTFVWLDAKRLCSCYSALSSQGERISVIWSWTLLPNANPVQGGIERTCLKEMKSSYAYLDLTSFLPASHFYKCYHCYKLYLYSCLLHSNCAISKTSA
jgi:hypothetical protein